MVKDTNYYYVCGWMLRLGLKGYQLPVYAIIYGFSQDGQSEFNGSLNYLAEFANCTQRNIQKVLIQLEDMGMIIKRSYYENQVKRVFYKAVVPREQSSMVENRVLGGKEQSSRGDRTDFTSPRELSSTNNKYIYKDIDKEKCNVDYNTAFALYEEKIGTISRTVAERIMAVVDDSGIEAFKKAVGKVNKPSKRNINYIDKTANDIAVNGDYDDIGKGSLSELPATLEEWIKMFGEKGDKDANKQG